MAHAGADEGGCRVDGSLLYRLQHISFALSELLRWAFRSMLVMMEFALSLRQGSGRILNMVTGGASSLSLPADSCPVSSEDIKSTVRIFIASFFSSAVIAVEVIQAFILLCAFYKNERYFNFNVILNNMTHVVLSLNLSLPLFGFVQLSR